MAYWFLPYTFSENPSVRATEIHIKKGDFPNVPNHQPV
jgi:hypothetical protein